MIPPEIHNQLDIFESNVRRGLKIAEATAPQLVDVFVHLTDEIQRTRKWIAERCIKAC